MTVITMQNAVLLLSLMAAATFSWVSGVVLAQESRTTAPGQSVIPAST